MNTVHVVIVFWRQRQQTETKSDVWTTVQLFQMLQFCEIDRTTRFRWNADKNNDNWKF